MNGVNKDCPAFSRTEGIEDKEKGMELAAEADASIEPLELARGIALRLATMYGETNADQVGQLLWTEHQIKSLGPAAGSIFKGPEWEFTGKRVLSTRVSNHAREIKVWRLK